MKKHWLIIAILLTLVLLSEQASAAWGATDNFNSYADGDLNGNNGGTGFSAAWSGPVDYDVQGTVTYEGAKAISAVLGDIGDMNRNITTSVTSGIARVAMRRSSLATGQPVVRFKNQANGGRWFINFGTTAIRLYDASGVNSVIILSSPSVDTWYEIHVSIDTTANTAKARLSTDSAWTATVTGANSGGIDQIALSTGGGASGTSYWDDITEGSEPGGGAAAPGPSGAGFFLLLGMFPPRKIHV